ncbi:hypothetical protein PIB30_041662 [Stylosanthes scabra]|uniref:Uncharacterized protein n=1 Tax=Stylosanthes scabra TaxID=79078 RepID=A0ABU6RFN6_9FABA|nr:hypothetical protein [Stylosanthes scabra]
MTAPAPLGLSPPHAASTLSFKRFGAGDSQAMGFKLPDDNDWSDWLLISLIEINLFLLHHRSCKHSKEVRILSQSIISNIFSIHVCIDCSSLSPIFKLNGDINQNLRTQLLFLNNDRKTILQMKLSVRGCAFVFQRHFDGN